MKIRIPSFEDYIAEQKAVNKSMSLVNNESLHARDVAKILGINDPAEQSVGLWVGLSNLIDEFELDVYKNLTREDDEYIIAYTNNASPSKDKSVIIGISNTGKSIYINRLEGTPGDIKAGSPTNWKTKESVLIEYDPLNILTKEILEKVAKALRKFVNITK